MNCLYPCGRELLLAENCHINDEEQKVKIYEYI